MVSVAAMNSDGDVRFVGVDANTGAPQTVLDADGERAFHADVVGHLGPFSLRAGFNDRKKNLPTGAYGTQPLLGTSYQDDRRGYAEFRFDQDLQHFHLAARAAYDESAFHGHYVDDPTSDENLGAQWITGELRLETPTFMHQRFTLGTEVAKQIQLETVEPTGPSIAKDLIASAYLVDDIQVTNRLHVNAGLRSDSYTKSFGSTLNPRLAIIAQPYLQGTTKLLVGRAFRAPSPNQRANTVGTDLRPEFISEFRDRAHPRGQRRRAHRRRAFRELAKRSHRRGQRPPGWHRLPEPDQPSAQPGRRGRAALGTWRRHAVFGFAHAPAGRGVVFNGKHTLLERAGHALQGARVVSAGRSDIAVRHRTGAGFGTTLPPTDPTAPVADDRVDDAVMWNLSLSGDYRTFRLRYFAGLFNVLDVHDPRAGIPTSIDFPLGLVPRYGRSLRTGLAWAF